MIDATPRMRRILAILLPSAFPMASPVFPLKLEMRLITSSGAEVPKATIVSPMTRLEIPYFFAIPADHSTSQSHHLMRRTNQSTKSIYSICEKKIFIKIISILSNMIAL